MYKKVLLNFYGGDAVSDVNKKIETYKAMIEITTGKERKRWVDRVYYYENRSKISEKDKDRYQKNKEVKKQRTRSYYEKNKEKINKKRRAEVKSEEFKQKERERLRKYKQENRDYVNKKSREWCEQNKDKRKQIQKKYRIKNALKIKEYRDSDDYKRKHFVWSKDWINKNRDRYESSKKQWLSKNREYVLWYNKQRSSKIKQASVGGSLYWREIGQIYKKCREMNEEAGFVKYHVDHVCPLRHEDVCGLHVFWNLRIIDAKDNIRKKNKLDTNLILS